MEALVVEGGHPVGGTVHISGFKHTLVLLLCASALVDGETVLRNVPDVEDTRVLRRILADLGVRVARDRSTLRIDARPMAHGRVDVGLSQRIHGAIYLLPSLLGRLGEVMLGATGGCRIGDRAAGGRRPVEHVVDVLERFGCRFRTAGGVLHGTTDGLRAAHIDIARFSDATDVVTGPFVSGATKTALLAASVARGVSRIERPYRKAEMTELVAFLSAGGVAIEDRGDHILVEGRPRLAPVDHRLICDVVEAVTFIAVAVCLRSPLRLLIDGSERMRRGIAPELELLDRMGVGHAWEQDGLVVQPPERVRAIDIEVTGESIYSDSHPFFALMLAGAGGASTIRERVWRDRFGYVDALVELGARIEPGDRSIRIHPQVPNRANRRVSGADLRAVSVLVLAALGIRGTTLVEGTEHLRRGYDDLPGKLRSIGARVSAPIAPVSG